MKRITADMRSYMNSGNCPRCGREILNFAYAFVNDELGLSAYATGLTFAQRLRLAPSSAPVTFTSPNTFTCLFCREHWQIREEGPQVLAARLQLGTATSQLFSTSLGAAAPSTPPTLSPAQFSLSTVEESDRAELLVRTDHRTMTNNSSAKVTDSDQFSCEWVRSVTVEDRRATIAGTEGRLTFAGLATLGRTLANELRAMYAVTSQTTLRRTRTIAVEVPPHSVIEIEAAWKLIRQRGIGHFPAQGGVCVDLPFEVDIDLALVWTTRNASGR